jgi:hypothetical protein
MNRMTEGPQGPDKTSFSLLRWAKEKMQKKKGFSTGGELSSTGVKTSAQLKRLAQVVTSAEARKKMRPTPSSALPVVAKGREVTTPEAVNEKKVTMESLKSFLEGLSTKEVGINIIGCSREDTMKQDRVAAESVCYDCIELIEKEKLSPKDVKLGCANIKKAVQIVIKNREEGGKALVDLEALLKKLEELPEASKAEIKSSLTALTALKKKERIKLLLEEKTEDLNIARRRIVIIGESKETEMFQKLLKQDPSFAELVKTRYAEATTIVEDHKVMNDLHEALQKINPKEGGATYSPEILNVIKKFVNYFQNVNLPKAYVHYDSCKGQLRELFKSNFLMSEELKQLKGNLNKMFALDTLTNVPKKRLPALPVPTAGGTSPFQPPKSLHEVPSPITRAPPPPKPLPLIPRKKNE